MLSVEAVGAGLATYLTANLATALAGICADGRNARVPVGAPKKWFVGEWNQYRAYEYPAGFITAASSINRLQGSQGPQLHDSFTHNFYVGIMLEGAGEEDLTLGCYRLAEAGYNLLHDKAIADTTAAGNALSQVQRVDYGPTMARAQNERVFRKDVTLVVVITHHDDFR